VCSKQGGAITLGHCVHYTFVHIVNKTVQTTTCHSELNFILRLHKIKLGHVNGADKQDDKTINISEAYLGKLPARTLLAYSRRYF